MKINGWQPVLQFLKNKIPKSEVGLEEVMSKDLQIKEQKNKIEGLENNVSELKKILSNSGAEME